MRTIAVVTTSRADWGLYRPVVAAMTETGDIRLQVIVSGTHLMPDHGMTVDEIVADGVAISDRLPLPFSGDDPLEVARVMSAATAGFAEILANRRPDLVLLLGDRFEMHAAAVAALPLGIPIAHVHGGELTQGAFDDSLRHSITKLSHLHFASTPEYGRRIVQMGEEPWRVVVSGAPGLDNLKLVQPLADDVLAARIGLPLNPAPVVVNYHPTTLDEKPLDQQISALLEPLSDLDLPLIFTAPNADPGGRLFRQRIEAFVARRKRVVLVESLGTQAYFTLMSKAAAMVGNSSSGIIEAASFRLPVLNIGSRQEGRLRAANVIDVATNAEDIRLGLARLLSPEFVMGLAGLRNPYDCGGAGHRIAEVLATVPLDRRLLVKRFQDIPGDAWTAF